MSATAQIRALTSEEVVAMWLFGEEYARGGTSAIDFYARLSASRKDMIAEMLRQIVSPALGSVREENARLLVYIERLEIANSTLHQQFAEEQKEREALVEMGTIMLAELTHWFQKIDALRGRGTPRSITPDNQRK